MDISSSKSVQRFQVLKKSLKNQQQGKQPSQHKVAIVKHVPQQIIKLKKSQQKRFSKINTKEFSEKPMSKFWQNAQNDTILLKQVDNINSIEKIQMKKKLQALRNSNQQKIAFFVQEEQKESEKVGPRTFQELLILKSNFQFNWLLLTSFSILVEVFYQKIYYRKLYQIAQKLLQIQHRLFIKNGIQKYKLSVIQQGNTMKERIICSTYQVFRLRFKVSLQKLKQKAHVIIVLTHIKNQQTLELIAIINNFQTQVQKIQRFWKEYLSRKEELRSILGIMWDVAVLEMNMHEKFCIENGLMKIGVIGVMKDLLDDEKKPFLKKYVNEKLRGFKNGFSKMLKQIQLFSKSMQLAIICLQYLYTFQWQKCYTAQLKASYINFFFQKRVLYFKNSLHLFSHFLIINQGNRIILSNIRKALKLQKIANFEEIRVLFLSQNDSFSEIIPILNNQTTSGNLKVMNFYNFDRPPAVQGPFSYPRLNVLNYLCGQFNTFKEASKQRVNLIKEKQKVLNARNIEVQINFRLIHNQYSFTSSSQSSSFSENPKNGGKPESRFSSFSLFQLRMKGFDTFSKVMKKIIQATPKNKKKFLTLKKEKRQGSLYNSETAPSKKKSKLKDSLVGSSLLKKDMESLSPVHPTSNSPVDHQAHTPNHNLNDSKLENSVKNPSSSSGKISNPAQINPLRHDVVASETFIQESQEPTFIPLIAMSPSARDMSTPKAKEGLAQSKNKHSKSFFKIKEPPSPRVAEITPRNKPLLSENKQSPPHNPFKRVPQSSPAENKPSSLVKVKYSREGSPQIAKQPSPEVLEQQSEIQKQTSIDPNGELSFSPLGREDYRSKLIKLTVSPTLELQRDLITSPNVEESSFIYAKKSLNSNSDNEHEHGIHSSQKMESQTNLLANSLQQSLVVPSNQPENPFRTQQQIHQEQSMFELRKKYHESRNAETNDMRKKSRQFNKLRYIGYESSTTLNTFSSQTNLLKPNLQSNDFGIKVQPAPSPSLPSKGQVLQLKSALPDKTVQVHQLSELKREETRKSKNFMRQLSSNNQKLKSSEKRKTLFTGNKTIEKFQEEKQHMHLLAMTQSQVHSKEIENLRTNNFLYSNLGKSIKKKNNDEISINFVQFDIFPTLTEMKKQILLILQGYFDKYIDNSTANIQETAKNIVQLTDEEIDKVVAYFADKKEL